MKGRESKGGPQSAELLVCFPPRATLTLLPKPTSKKITPNSSSDPLDSEPTSPKVTCSGQIKVRPNRPSSCKNWQSVMEEIEKLHSNKKLKKKLNWLESSMGFKKDIMQFLTCLQTLKFDFRCFGSIPNSDMASDDDDDEEEDDRISAERIDDDHESSRTVFSKWFMALTEDENRGFVEENRDMTESPCAPPANALLLMRSRSAPAKSWLEEEEEEDEEEEKEEEKPNMVMGYDSDFYKISSDIAKETWVVGGIRDLLSRSRSSKR